MKFQKEMIEKYYFLFDSEETIELGKQKINICGGYAIFMLDTTSYTLSIESDWGHFGYRWGASKDETFKELLIRIGNSKQYLLRKLSSETEINWKKTKKETIKSFFRHCSGLNKDERADFIKTVNDFEDYDKEGAIFYDRVYNLCPSMWETICIVKEFSLGAQIVVEILSQYLVQALKEETQERKQ